MAVRLTAGQPMTRRGTTINIDGLGIFAAIAFLTIAFRAGIDIAISAMRTTPAATLTLGYGIILCIISRTTISFIKARTNAATDNTADHGTGQVNEWAAGISLVNGVWLWTTI